MESFYFDTTLITISVIGLTSIAGGLTLKLKKYVQWYNTERIQKKLGYLSPVEYRLKYLN